MRTSQPKLKYVLSDITSKLFSPRIGKARKKHSSKIERVVRWFEKNGDALVGEIRADDLELSKLQKLFNVSENNPMYDCYPIKTKRQIRYIWKTTHHPIDLFAYDYFLECDGDGVTLTTSGSSTTSSCE